MRRRRRRAAVLAALAVACGGLASSEVENRARSARVQTGPLVPAVVARADLRAGTRLRPGAGLDRLLAVREVPERFAPPDSLVAPGDAAGRTLTAPVAAGGYLTEGALDGAGRNRDAAPAPGERAIDVAVAAGGEVGEAGSGARVDVLVTTDRGEGRGRSYVAIEDVQLLAVRPADQGGGSNSQSGAGARATAVATLRVTLRQAVFLTAAQSFAREIRLLLRPPGERRSARGAVIDGASL